MQAIFYVPPPTPHTYNEYDVPLITAFHMMQMNFIQAILYYFTCNKCKGRWTQVQPMKNYVPDSTVVGLSLFSCFILLFFIESKIVQPIQSSNVVTDYSSLESTLSGGIQPRLTDLEWERMYSTPEEFL